jgi:hypothetical protein
VRSMLGRCADVLTLLNGRLFANHRYHGTKAPSGGMVRCMITLMTD